MIDHVFNDAMNGFKYLGIHVAPAIWDLVAINYEPVTTAVTDSVNIGPLCLYLLLDILTKLR